MTKHWFIGWDPRDELASRVAIRSARANSHSVRAGEIQVHILKDHLLRDGGFYWRPYEVRPNGQIIDGLDGKPCSTQFSFTRFCVPEIARRMGVDGPVLFTDPDFMFRGDIDRLFAEWDDKYEVMCVKHSHTPREDTKMSGLQQTRYFRKNWSSLMLVDPNKTLDLSAHEVNTQKGAWLHAMMWAGGDKAIGSLSKNWNHLVGYNPIDAKARGVHFTLGTPDMVGGDGEQEHAHEWWNYVRPLELEGMVYSDVSLRPEEKKEDAK